MGKLLALAILGLVLAFLENGSEDIDILPSGLAFLSTGLNYRGMHCFEPDKPGAIFLVDLKEETPRARPLPIRNDFDVQSFNPHGINLFTDKDGAVFLYVVNHPHMKSAIEVFKFEEESLFHVKTITHELLSSVNDIVVLGPDQFYATNDHYFTNYFLAQLEIYLDLQWTNVIYYSPGEVKEVANGLSIANGIAVSPDKRYIYVAAGTTCTIHVMERLDNWNLIPEKVLDVDTLVDNLFVDPATGDVWAGCHPNGMKLINYDPADPPGSEVIRIQNILSQKPKVTTVYANDGSVLQGSTVAVVYNQKMLVGTVFHKTLYCDL